VSGRVIVVGSVNVDLVVNAARLPSPGETVTGGTFARHDGGKGGNQAVAAARVGASVAFVGAVGDDDLGERARAALEESGVDVSQLATVAGIATGVALIVVAGGGENQIAVASGANEHVTPERVRDGLTRLAPGRDDVVLCVHEIPTAAVREALRLVRAAGARTILNPAPAGGVDRAVFGGVTVVTPNRHELATLVQAEARWTGRAATADTQKAARTLIDASPEGPGADAVVVTLGALGALIVERTGSIEVAAPRLAAVDTVGAGDALNGVLAAGLAEGRSLEESVRRAVVAASVSTLRAGAREGMPTAAELERALVDV
jgi:ribokinase